MNLNNIDDALNEVMNINGAIGTAVLDWNSGMTLGSKSISDFAIDVAAAGNAEVIKAKMNTMKSLGLDGGVEDILITLTNQIHIITMIKEQPELALYVALDSSKANLALARNQMTTVAKS